MFPSAPREAASPRSVAGDRTVSLGLGTGGSGMEQGWALSEAPRGPGSHSGASGEMNGMAFH